jgi:hypothetical protein
MAALPLLLLLVAPGADAGRYTVALWQRALLAPLDAGRLRLRAQLDPHAAAAADRNNAALLREPLYAQLVAALDADLRDAGQAVAAAPPATGPGHVFPGAWLRSRDAFFELVGVINRIDRAPFLPGTCGELRLIYRLAYRRELAPGRVAASRLPMTINLVYELPGPRCTQVAARWLAPREPARVAEWLASARGPLALLGGGPSRLEVNLQFQRWAPGYRVDLGGNTTYLLRVFRIDRAHAKLVVQPLENTPDVDRIVASPSLRADLLHFLSTPPATLAILLGSLVLPERFDATRAISVTPLGLGRLPNRPFLHLLRDEPALSARARRLDGLTCMGCHQSRSMAGFHFLGEDDASDNGVNALYSPGSDHFRDELARRQLYGEDLLAGRTPAHERPFAERAQRGASGYGAHCQLGDAPSREWRCAEGLVCTRYFNSPLDDSVGACLPPKPHVGDPCQLGAVSPDRDPRQETVVAARRVYCPARTQCMPAEIGFPGGTCASVCPPPEPDAICQRVPALARFTDCMASGATFRECFASAAEPLGLRACDAARSCRDDYLCARTTSGQGVCVPPYFLFQLVIDGHPSLR